MDWSPAVTSSAAAEAKGDGPSPEGLFHACGGLFQSVNGGGRLLPFGSRVADTEGVGEIPPHHHQPPAMTTAELAKIEARMKALGARANRELDDRLLAITGSSDPKVHQTWASPSKARKY
jgi:hypothetical protein